LTKLSLVFYTIFLTKYPRRNIEVKKFIGIILLSALTMAVLISCTPKSDGTVDVGIVFPTKDEVRWTMDERRMNEALGSYGFKAELLFSQNDSATELRNVETLLAKGIKVLILAAVDSGAAVNAIEKAKAEGVITIAYDRPISDTKAVDYFVSFDGFEIGRLQGQYLVDHATGTGNSLYLSAGAANDENSFWFFEGDWAALQPAIVNGTFRVVNSSEAVAVQSKPTLTRGEQSAIVSQITQSWNMNEAKNKAESFLVSAPASDKGHIYVLEPNGAIARVIYDVLTSDPDITAVTITGQDSEKDSIQYIIDGKQSMDVFKDARSLVKVALDVADAVVNGKTYPTTAVSNNNVKDVPAVFVAPTVVDKSNLKEMIFDSGYYDEADFNWANF
jgi:putative multiple sugar transport system substrate-binding protein